MKNVKIKKGTILEIKHKRKGNFTGIALEDFSLLDEWYPIAVAHKEGAPSGVVGLNNYWLAGEEIPCRGEFCEVKILGDNAPKKIGQMRGALTKRIKQKSKELFGYEIGVVELRLMVYIQYVLVNEQKIDSRKVNDEEREIMERWDIQKHAEVGNGRVIPTKAFWDAICEIIYLGYVDID
jgi:hypothetical protein